MPIRLLLFLSGFLILVVPVFFAQSPAVPANASPVEVRSAVEMREHIVGLHSRKFYDLAQKQAETFLQRYPTDESAQEIIEILIDCLRQQKLDDEAIRWMRSFLEKHPDNRQWAFYSLQLGDLLFNRGSFAEAADFYAKTAEKSRAEHLTAHASYNRALCFTKLGMEKQAKEIIEKLASAPLKGKGSSDSAREKHLQILILARQFAARYKSDANDYKGAMTIYQEMLASGKLDDDTRCSVLDNAAILSFNNNDYKAAMTFAGRHYAEFPQAPRRALLRRIFLFSLYNDGQYQQFLKNTSEFRQEFPNEELTSLLLKCIDASAQLKLYDRQLQWIAIFLKESGISEAQRAEAEYHRIIALYNLGRSKEAYEDGRRYISRHAPTVSWHREVLKIIGTLAAAHKDHRAATSHFIQLLPLLADDPQTYAEYAVKLAAAHAELQEWSKASEAMLKAVNVSERQTQPALLIYAAQYAQNAKDFDRADQIASSLLARFPENRDYVIMALGIRYNCAVIMKKLPEALKIANDAIGRLSGDTRCGGWLYRLANVQLEMEQYEHSASSLQRMLALSNADEASRVNALNLLLPLLCYLQKPGEALQYLPEALQLLPAESPSAANLQLLAEYASSSNLQLAMQLWQRLEKHPGAAAALRDKAIAQRAILLAGSSPAEAKKLLDALEASCLGRGIPLPAEAAAMLAEISLDLKAYANAENYARNARRQQEIDTESNARALWVLAKCIYDQDNDLNTALSYATQIYMMQKRSPRYAPMALHLTAQIFRQQGKIESANETEAELKRDFPLWQAPVSKNDAQRKNNR